MDEFGDQLAYNGFVLRFVVGEMARPLSSGEHFAATAHSVVRRGSRSRRRYPLPAETFGHTAEEAVERLKLAFEAWASAQAASSDSGTIRVE
jgi:hypothetical protein